MDTTVTLETPDPATTTPATPAVVVVTPQASAESATETEAEQSKILELAERVGALTATVESFRLELAAAKQDLANAVADMEVEEPEAEEVIPLAPEIPTTPQASEAPKKASGMLRTIFLGK